MTAASRDVAEIPYGSLVLIIGISSSGKSSLARRLFPWPAVLSSDEFRTRLSDDENCLEITPDVFRLMGEIAKVRLERRLLTVVDAMNINEECRLPFKRIADALGRPALGLVLDVPYETCLERHRRRPERPWPDPILEEQFSRFSRTLAALQDEGYARLIHVTPQDATSCSSESDLLRVTVERNGS